MRLRAFLRSSSGASAAEFAIVLPLFLLLLFGTIDLGRYAWELNQAEKATQMGARWAVATDMIPSGLYSYSFASGGGVEQGTPVPQTKFPGVICKGSASSVSCQCATGGTCDFPLTANQTAFNNLVERMQDIYPSIQPQNVLVNYAWSGLGFAGDPNGPDVAPLTTVSLRNMQFTPFTTFLFNGTVDLPSSPYSLPMEDGSGSTSN